MSQAPVRDLEEPDEIFLHFDSQYYKHFYFFVACQRSRRIVFFFCFTLLYSLYTHALLQNADKPRDSFVQMPPWVGGRGGPFKNKLLPYIRYHGDSFCVKGCSHNYRRTAKLGSDGTPISWVGGVADSKIYAPPPRLLLCRKMGVLR